MNIVNVSLSEAGILRLKDQGEFKEPKTGTQADAAPAMAASYFHQVAGANHFRRKLKELTREPGEKKAPRVRSLARTEDDLPKDQK